LNISLVHPRLIGDSSYYVSFGHAYMN
jgi:hypothetical protein